MLENIIVGLDIGTTKIVTIVCERLPDGQLKVIGMGSSISKGLRKSVVVDLESTIESINQSIEKAELSCDIEIDTVFAGISGGHIKSFNSRGLIVARPSTEFTDKEVERAVEAAKAVSLPMDREVLHCLPLDFIVDGQSFVRDPRGMTGVRLEAEVHLITGAVTSAQNIIKSIHRAGVEVADIVLEPLASGLATLTEEEKESGVILMDIGGGTTDYLVYSEGLVRHTGVLAVGGDHVTNDIAVALEIPASKAEMIKKKFGNALESEVDKNEQFVLQGGLDRPSKNFSKRQLAEIIEYRMIELLGLIKNEIQQSGYGHMVDAGVVLTGGAALLPGILKLAEKIFKLPVRLGLPIGMKGLVDVINSPIYATSVGLAKYGSNFLLSGGIHRFKGRNMFQKTVERMQEWVSEFF